MIVFSPLSLYTTFLGWQAYDLMFDAFLQTGLWFLGFLYIGYRFFTRIAAPSGATHHAAEHALNHFIYELLILVIMLALFVVPCVSMKAESFEFHPACSGTGDAQVIGNTGTTYDDNFQSLVDGDVKIPIGFALLQNFVGSLTYSLMQASTCVDGLNNIKSDMISTHLPEDMQQELTDFKKQCFWEARLSFKAHPLEGADKKANYERTLKTYGGEGDLRWLGSHVLRENYYKDINAKSPVKRYAYSNYPSTSLQKAITNKEIDKQHLPKYGFPDCETWWVDIRDALKDLTDDTSFTNGNFENRKVYMRVVQALNERGVAGHQDNNNHDINHEVALDIIAKTLIENNNDTLDKVTALSNTNNNAFQSYMASGLNRIGQGMKSYTYTPLKRESIRQTLPVMQAIAMYFVIIIMPLVVSISGGSPKAIGAFCGIFAVLIFINFYWFEVKGLESRLLESVDGHGDLVSLVQNIAVMFYFVAPLLLLRLSALWGAGSAGMLTEMMNSGETETSDNANRGHSAGSQAASLAGGKAAIAAKSLRK